MSPHIIPPPHPPTHLPKKCKLAFQRAMPDYNSLKIEHFVEQISYNTVHTPAYMSYPVMYVQTLYNPGGFKSAELELLHPTNHLPPPSPYFSKKRILAELTLTSNEY